MASTMITVDFTGVSLSVAVFYGLHLPRITPMVQSMKWFPPVSFTVTLQVAKWQFFTMITQYRATRRCFVNDDLLSNLKVQVRHQCQSALHYYSTATAASL